MSALGRSSSIAGGAVKITADKGGRAAGSRPLRFRPRNPGIDVHFGDSEAPGLGIGAEGVELDFGVLVCGGNSGVQGDSGHGGTLLCRTTNYFTGTNKSKVIH